MWGGGVSDGIRAQSETVDQQLRISAQRLENGRVQFGLRLPDGAGGWEEPVQPRVNWFLPSAGVANRWLSSSALTLERVGDTAALTRSEDFDAVSVPPLVGQWPYETWDANVSYSQWSTVSGWLGGSLSLYTPAAGTVDGELLTRISCGADGISVYVFGLPPTERSEPWDVSWSVDGGTSQTERWTPSMVPTGVLFAAPAGSELPAALLSGRAALALSLGDEITSSLDLRALQATPVYDTLTECGVEPTVRAGTTEVRIQAFLRQDGSNTDGARVVFALQQRQADGSWGERILPRLRTMPAYGDPSNWASSTPIGVTLDVASVTRNVSIVGERDPDAEPISPRLGAGGASGGVEFEASLDSETGTVSSYLRQHSQGPLVLEVSCLNGQRSVGLSGIPEDAGDRLAFDLDGQQSEVQWANGALDDERVIQRLSGGSSLTIGEGTSAESSFDVSRLFTSPIQRNIEQCGNYTDPSWSLVTREYQHTEHQDQTFYNNRIGDPAQRGLGLNTHISANGRTGGQIGIDCFNVISPNHWLQSYVRPPDGPLDLDIGNHWARITTDGEQDSRHWMFVRHSENGPLHISHDQKAAYHALLMSSATAQIVFDALPDAPLSINTRWLFSSPVQANIENCGQPLWPSVNDYVPSVGSGGTRAAGYSTGSAHPDNGLGNTSVSTNFGPAAAPDVTLGLSCLSTARIYFSVNNLPVIDPGQTEVSMAIGDQEPVRAEWFASPYTIDRDSGNALSSRIHIFPDPVAIAQLMIADTITIEAHDTSLGAISIPLAGLFDTPLQENIDNCVFTEPGNDLNVRIAFRLLDDGRVEFGLQEQSAEGEWSETSLPEQRYLPASGLSEQWRGGGEVTIGSFAHLLEARVSARRGPDGQVEFAVERRVNRRAWSERLLSDDRFLAADAEADVWYQTGPVSVGKHPGPTRMLEQQSSQVADDQSNRELPADSFVTSGFHEVNGRGYSWSRDRTPIGGVSVAVTVNPEDQQVLYLLFRVSCTDAGPGAFLLLLPPLSGNPALLPVNWQVDSGDISTEQWTVTSTTFSYISPPSARAFYAAIRQGSELSLSFEGDSTVSQVYDLTAIFGTPIQESLDECVAAEVSAAAAPVESSPTVDGDIQYGAPNVGGQDVATTYVTLQIPDHSTRLGYSSSLRVSCAGARLGVNVFGIGLEDGRVIDGVTVDVTWQADDGAPRTESWNAWPGSNGGFHVSPPDDLAVFNAIKGAETFTITVASMPEFTQTYELATNGFWETPVQPNLDICGG